MVKSNKINNKLIKMNKKKYVQSQNYFCSESCDFITFSLQVTITKWGSIFTEIEPNLPVPYCHAYCQNQHGQ